MIVTVCGAYRNCGDHLIGDRARSLVRAFVDDDIVVVDRKAVSNETYDVFNRARAILLTGGPAYNRYIYPRVYPLDLERIEPPVIPFGLGWKAPVDTAPGKFKFTPESIEFIQKIHSTIDSSSARDPLTVSAIKRLGITNIEMTGCPAWYDLTKLEQTYSFNPKVSSLVLSMPAKMQPGVKELMVWLTNRYPNAKKVASFHHGVIPAYDKVGRERAYAFVRFSASAMKRGWKISSPAGSLSKMEKVYGQADLHIGYRVHAHLLCLSQRKSSILINEDIRGVGQAQALGGPVLNVTKSKNIGPIAAAVEQHFESRGDTVSQSVETMRTKFLVMKRFLETI